MPPVKSGDLVEAACDRQVLADLAVPDPVIDMLMRGGCLVALDEVRHPEPAWALWDPVRDGRCERMYRVPSRLLRRSKRDW